MSYYSDSMKSPGHNRYAQAPNVSSVHRGGADHRPKAVHSLCRLNHIDASIFLFRKVTPRQIIDRRLRTHCAVSTTLTCRAMHIVNRLQTKPNFPIEAKSTIHTGSVGVQASIRNHCASVKRYIACQSGYTATMCTSASIGRCTRMSLSG